MRTKKPKAPALGRIKALGITQLSQILLFVPHKYVEYGTVERKLPAPDNARHVFMLKLVKKAFFQQPSPRMSMTLADAGGTTVTATLWGNFFEWREVALESILFVEGTLTTWRDDLVIKDPKQIPPHYLGSVVAVYKGLKGVVSATTIAEKVKEHFDGHAESAIISIENALGLHRDEVAKKIAFPSLREWLKALHFPETLASGESAKAAVHLISALEIINKAQKVAARAPCERSRIPLKSADLQRLIAGLPQEISLTSDQKKAINDVAADLCSELPANRLISGDVGTGKSLAFMVPAIAAVHAGAKVAIMVPMTLLIRNAANEAFRVDPKLDVLLHAAGKPIPIDTRMVIGTHAIISAARKSGWVPDMLIIDEQHKLGLESRATLVHEHTNVIEATATAIPRSLALITHGGMDVSILRSSPFARQITTRIVNAEAREMLFSYIKSKVAEGHQAAFVYPLVEEATEKKRKNRQATQAQQGTLLTPTGAVVQSVESAMAMVERAFPGRARMLHGGLLTEEKEETLAAMQRGEFDVLVTSTSLELGVTVPRLRILVLVDPKGMGLATLHQLRGRLARLGGGGLCVIYNPDECLNDTTRARYEAFASTNDGFKIAEWDLEARGMGDLDDTGDNQAGATRTLFPQVSVTPADLAAALGGSPDLAAA